MLTKDQIKEIARTYGRTEGATSLGRKLGRTKQRIQQIAYALRVLGVDIPRDCSWKGRRYGKVIEELREESPELFEES